MWPDFVVAFSPFINNLPGFFQRPEPVLIQTAIPELAIEAFNKGILGWLAGLDKLQPDLVVPAPEEHSLGGKLCAVVTANASGSASPCSFAWQELLCLLNPTRRQVNPISFFILADDLDIGDTNVYGGEIIRTLNIDALAASGVRFAQGCGSNTAIRDSVPS